MKTGRDAVDQMAKISRIYLTEEEKSFLGQELDRFLNYVGELHKLDTEGVEPLRSLSRDRNVLREDKVWKSLSTHDVLRNARGKSEGHFKVPRIIEE